MKHTINYTLGYLGYFLLVFIALRFILVQNDKTSFLLTVIGIFLLINYVSYFEKQNGTPKYSGYIKLTLFILFLFTGFITM